MLTGLEILLARMKTNPEEFLDRGHVPYEGQVFGGKWADLLDYAWRVGDNEDQEALAAARKEFYRDDFNERVMKRLAGEEVKQEVSPYIIKGSSVNAIHPMQNSVIQGGTINTTIGQAALQANGFGQAQIKQEGAMVGGGSGFLGLGKLF